MRCARKPGAMGPQNSETRKSQILMLRAPYFRVPHTQHWDGRWGGVGKNPLGRLQVPLSRSAPSPAGPNIPITYTHASQHCIPRLVPPAKPPFPQIAKSQCPIPRPPTMLPS